MNHRNCYWWKSCLSFAFQKLQLSVIALLITSFGFSQTTNISGIINSYHKVLGISLVAAKLDNVSGLAYGNTVLVIQMKGATINTTNSASFGSVTALNYAGNYEVATICSVSNDTVYFFNELLNSYDVAFDVQLVKFGEYYSALVTDTIKAQSWNNTTGKGGVLAIKVEEDLTLNAPVYADSTGYKGGNFVLSGSTCGSFHTAYIYNATFSTQNGAYKGEGIVNVTAAMSGGRGAPANGGGGGNNHNNGGGGGSNLVAGGYGGGNYTTVSGACINDYHGLGGWALSSSSGDKIYAGGGGGAGHANNNNSTHGGGNGGGIIIIIAKNIVGNGQKIVANGRVGGNGASDGASGGGAGGTIIMQVTNSYSGTLTIEAKGGNGGNADNQNITNRCYGAGGGGSGGTIYFNGTVPAVTTSVAAGLAGLDLRVVGCATPPAVAQTGTNGSMITGYSYRTSVDPSSSCNATALPVRIIYFNAILNTNGQVRLEWDVANPEEATSFTIEKINALNKWVDISTINADPNLHHYEVSDLAPEPGENIYRLRVNGKDNQSFYSAQKRIFIKYNSRFSVYPNPAKNKITISGDLKPGMTIKLSAMNGKVVKEVSTNISLALLEIILPSLPAGIYLVSVDNYIQKIVILD